MTPSQYIQANYSQIKEWLYNITNGERPDLFEDFVHEVIIIFLDNKNSQQAIDTGTARYFLVRIGLNQWRSSTSPFHYQHRLIHTEPINNDNISSNDYDPTIDLNTEVMFEALNIMFESKKRYEAYVIILYHSLGNNYSAVGRKLNLQATTIRKIYLRGIKTLKSIANGINNDTNSSRDVHSNSTHLSSISRIVKIFETGYFSETKSVK